jgi:hypothetical protein
MIPTHSILSLQGTLAKLTKPALQPNFAKEPFRPSRSNDGLRHCTNMIDKQTKDNNRQCLTRNIANGGGCGSLKLSAPHQSL